MSVQNTYQENQDEARQGQIANTEINFLISREVEGTAGLEFGIPVAQGTTDYQVKATAAGVTSILGVTVRERSTIGANKFLENDSARVMTKGVIWVTVGENVVAGDPVYVTVATGAFKKTASGNVAIANARWDSSASSGNLAKLRLG
jgi:hypothetical protein